MISSTYLIYWMSCPVLICLALPAICGYYILSQNTNIHSEPSIYWLEAREKQRRGVRGLLMRWRHERQGKESTEQQICLMYGNKIKKWKYVQEYRYRYRFNNMIMFFGFRGWSPMYAEDIEAHLFMCLQPWLCLFRAEVCFLRYCADTGGEKPKWKLNTQKPRGTCTANLSWVGFLEWKGWIQPKNE